MKTSFIEISANTLRVLGLTLLTILSFSLLSFKANSPRFRLKVANVKERGTLYVSFCTDASEWTENGQFTFEFAASPTGNDTYEINTLPKGTYAIAMYQDLNGNGVLDTNLFRSPENPTHFLTM